MGYHLFTRVGGPGDAVDAADAADVTDAAGVTDVTDATYGGNTHVWMAGSILFVVGFSYKYFILNGGT